MRILTRYVIAELLTVFLVSLGVLTLTMIIVGVVREAATQNLPMVHIARLIPYVLPDALRVAVPVTLLLAVSNVYSRMSGANEVVALKSAGVSPCALVWPALAVAFLLSLVAVWLNDVACSWGCEGVHRVVVGAVEDVVYGMLRAQRRYSAPGLSINVQRVEGRRMIRPTLSIQPGPNAPGLTITAEEAELVADFDHDLIRLILRNGSFDVDGQLSVEFPDVHEQSIPLNSATRALDRAGHPSAIPMLLLPGEIAAQEQRLRDLAAQRPQPSGDESSTPTSEDHHSREWHTAFQAEQERLYRLKTEPHRRWSAGFSCLFFAWVGAPMAVWLRNRDALANFFLCFLPILVVYYPLLAYGINGAKYGTIPPWSVWAGNVLLAVWGFALLRKVIRY